MNVPDADPLGEADLPEEPQVLEELAQLISGVGCLICHNAFDPDRVELLARQDAAWLLSAYCDTCEMHQLVVVLIHEVAQGEPLISVGEMTWEEWQAAHSRAPITLADVQEVAQALQRHSTLSDLL